MMKLWAHLLLLAFGAFQVYQATSINRGINSDTSENFVVCGEDGFYPSDDIYCSQIYYYCIDGTPYSQTCPGSSVFDPALLECVGLVNATGCQDPGNSGPTTIPTTAGTETTSAGTPPSSGDAQCLSPDGFFSIPGQCGKYFTVCVNGTSYQETCDGGTVFDPVTLLCVEYVDATCNLDNFGACPETNGFFPLTLDACCPSYISCINSVPYLAGCPAPKSVFEPVARDCETVDVAACWSSQKNLHQLKSSPNKVLS